MKPVVLPMLPLLCIRENGRRLAGDVGMVAAAHTEDSLELARENFDKPRGGFVPVVQNPLSAAAAGEFHVACDEITHALHILHLHQWFEVDRVRIATLLGKVSALVEDICQASAHTRREVSAAGAKDQHEPIGHVFTTVIANALDDRGRTGIAYGKTPAGYAVEEGFAASGAIESNVADDDVFFGSETGGARRIDD